MKLPLGLPARIALLTLTFTMLGVVVISYVNFLGTKQLLQEQILTHTTSQLHQSSSQYINHLKELKYTLLTLAKSETVSQVLLPANMGEGTWTAPPTEPYKRRVARRFASIMAHNPVYVQIRLLALTQEAQNGQSQEIVRVDRGTKGAIVHTIKKIPQEESNLPYMQKALRLRPSQFHIFSVPENSEEGSSLPQKTRLRVATPIFTDSHARSGLLVVEINYQPVIGPLSQQTSDTYILMTDGQGDYLYISKNTEEDIFIDTQKTPNIQQTFPSVDFFSAKTLSQAKKTSISSSPPHDSLYTTKPTQIGVPAHKMGMAFQRIYFDPMDPNRHVLMVAVTSNKAITKRSQRYWHDLLKTSLVVALGLSVLIVLMTRRLTRPILYLTQAIHRITAGEEDVQIVSNGADEVGELALAFQTMLEHLRYSNAALQELATSLEEQVRERTEDLAVARDQALAASEAKSSFLAIMSHEIRTPMNVVLGMLELLRLSEMSLPDKERVELAYGSGNTLLNLINNILDFSKIEARKITLDKVNFDLRRLVYESAMTVAPLAHAKEIELTAFFPDVPFTAVRGDPIRLRQIFTNLLGNAIKFTTEGGSVELHGGPINSEENTIDLLFEVRDSGIGILAEDREKVFNQFTQADSSSTRNHEGTGLGLSICKHLVQLMHGEISVEPNPHTPSGSVFHFSVRLDKQQQQPYIQTEKRQDFKNLRVLAVANDGLQRALVEDVLIPRGARLDHVSEIETVTETLRQAESMGQPYQLVLSNQKLGKSNRYEFRRLLDFNTELRFILITDLLDQGWDQATELPGTAICLKKPINSERLHAAIEWLINNEGNHQQSPIASTYQEQENMDCSASILIVDDQQANLTVTRGMLASIGCRPEQISTAINGREAIAIFQEKSFDLVLMDCQMPVMDGFGATLAIQAWEKEMGRVPVPIVAFTADITPKSQDRIQSCGMDGFLSKPVTIADLRNQLNRLSLLKRREPEAQLSHAPTQQAEKEASAPSSADPKGGHVDMEALLKSMRSIGLQEEDFREVADLLAAQFLELLNNMHRDFDQEDHQSARATAHVVKGSMANTIFPTLQKPTRTLYEAVREKNWGEARVELEHVKGLFLPIQAALLAFLAKDKEEGGTSDQPS